MPGGKGNIRPEDNPKPFEKGNNYAEKWNEEDALKLGNHLIEWMRQSDENIFFDEFLFLVVDESEYRGKIYADLIAYLSKKYSTFFDLIKIAAKIEETKLKKFSIFDKLNATMTKFVLMNCHKWSDKTEQTVDDKRDKTIEITIKESEKPTLKITTPDD